MRPRRFSEKMLYEFLHGVTIERLADRYHMPWDDMRELIKKASADISRRSGPNAVKKGLFKKDDI